ncbi:DNA polymerase [Pontiella desulfatans]|uniref:DNA polymerase n=1 Tax=Pontiella desulfatans TaxID=2750659 RepID=UPI001443B2E5|nr:DNA polymerase [Pontiella desulfatans]
MIRLWRDDLLKLDRAPFAAGRSSLVIAYYAAAEMSCFLELGWPLPVNVVDLHVEFRCATNGVPVAHGNGLVGALIYFGLPVTGLDDKDEIRSLIIDNCIYTGDQRKRILEYCESDVSAAARLWEVLCDSLTDPYCRWRGEYTKSIAAMERRGIPVDVEKLDYISEHRSEIVTALITEAEQRLGCRFFIDDCFNTRLFTEWVRVRGIDWPRLESGALALNDGVFRDMAKVHPDVDVVRTLRRTLIQLRNNKLAVGPDGRNRCILSPFASVTGRNQPSSSKFIFGQSKWLRSVIRPEPGKALAYIDWDQQEFGIAAALSGDKAMMTAYDSGDPYLGFAKLVGAVSPSATRETHGAERDIYKTVVLGVQYSMGEAGLAARLACSRLEARNLLKQHRAAFSRFWQWQERVVNSAILTGRLRTVFDWQRAVPADANPRSLANFPMQGNGAEMMRMAAVLATEAGIGICAPVHDAFLIEADADSVDSDVACMQSCMTKASAAVLGGFKLRSDAEIVRYPDRFDFGGEWVWDVINRSLDPYQI